eukprot:CAMPEP_0119353760 /NCGR_PEP_ID=MMETSP1334-20130426/2859_1 /TAXON_ID=127549 /ORGANISM="Calcidiscus leptoporus, Strain RCC1130" /LENGTH=157 /DNA_ID=CAMNT_0007367127 /DNA_START=60 /DNA_END=533 /DNA_ORIENTATION=-
MLRNLLLLAAALFSADALVVTPAGAVARVSRCASPEMFGGAKKAPPKKVAKKAPAKKAAAKKAPAKKVVKKVAKKVVKKVVKKAPPKKVVKAVTKKGSSPVGKGGIFPWVTNTPGTYAEVAKLSSFDFTGGDGAKFTAGAGVFGLSKFLYPGGRSKK